MYNLGSGKFTLFKSWLNVRTYNIALVLAQNNQFFPILKRSGLDSGYKIFELF